MRREVRRSRFLTVGSQERTGLFQYHHLFPAYNLICTFPDRISAPLGHLYTGLGLGIFPPLLCSGTTIEGSWQLSHSLDIAGEDPDPAWEPWSSWESRGSGVSAQVISPLPLQHCSSFSWGEDGWCLCGWLVVGARSWWLEEMRVCISPVPVVGGWRCPAPRGIVFDLGALCAAGWSGFGSPGFVL